MIVFGSCNDQYHDKDGNFKVVNESDKKDTIFIHDTTFIHFGNTIIHDTITLRTTSKTPKTDKIVTRHKLVRSDTIFLNQ